VNPNLDNMRIIMDLRGGSFLYAHAFNKSHANEQFISETLLTYQISGTTHIFSEQGKVILNEGQLILARRNQLVKSTKIPPENKKCQCLSVILTLDRLQKFALDNGIECKDRYEGEKLVLMEPNDFLKKYYCSLMSYAELWNNESDKLATLKVDEAIELLLQMRPDLKSFLFDFVEPDKQDLKRFMRKSFRYNVSIKEFAKLSGRSLTSFKRDFAEIFDTPPALWLKNQRLSEAFHLIKEKNRKPEDIYHDLGFENLSHFYTAFKHRFGITPSQVKSRAASNQVQEAIL
jgi:AraC-like DNA-binding protein